MKLSNIIKTEIESRDKKISFREFMQMALYHHDLGYYSGDKDKISSQGDFITATSQTSIFACVFANQFSEILKKVGQGWSIIEFGAGTGKFACDCMAELDRLGLLPKSYLIIELSNNLKSKQKNYIKQNQPHLFHKFIWLNELPKEKIKAIVFANEVLDAMPVDIFRAKNNKLIQQGVTFKDDKFQFIDLDKNDTRFDYEARRILDDGIDFEDDYTSELNVWIRPWIKALAENLDAGVIFLCDYGYHRGLYYMSERNMGTLACYHQHKVNFDPFENVGEQDITAHVDFTAVAEAIVENGFELEGYMTQADFLRRADIIKIFPKILKSQNHQDKIEYSNDIKKLLLDDKLAEVFKVFAFSVGFEPTLEVFDNEDNIDFLL